VLVLVLVFAGGAWAVDINTACGGATCTLGSGEYSGYATGKAVTFSNGAVITLNNLTVVGDLYPAVQVAAGGSVTINLEGTNMLNGGIGGAALRVPTNATVTINGPGTLIATGGMWRSLISSDAGAGIGGGNTTTTGGTNAGNLTDGCGTVIIKGGTINAYGGGSGESGTNNTGRCGYAAGIGGSGRGGAGCNLTINGGTITAVGGNQSVAGGINDIGPGLGYASGNATCAPTGTPNSIGTDNGIKINGGSVQGKIYVSGFTRQVTTTVTTITHRLGKTTDADCMACDRTVAQGTSNITGNNDNECIRCTATGTNTCSGTYTRGTPAATIATYNLFAGECKFFTTTTTSASSIQSLSSSSNASSSNSTANGTITITAVNSVANNNAIADIGTCSAADCIGYGNNGGTYTFTSTDESKLHYLPNGTIKACIICTRNGCGTPTVSFRGVTATGGNTISQNSCRTITVNFNNGTATNVANSATTPASVNNSEGTSLTKHTFGVGVLNVSESGNKEVTDCNFNNSNITCNNTPNAASRVYGINDVKTDGTGKVYFYLPTTSPLSNTLASNLKIHINEDKNYNYKGMDAGVGVFQGELPEIRPAVPSPNSFVCTAEELLSKDNECTAVGPYKTGFKMRGYDHVAAVNHPITLIKGEYIRNDSREEAGTNGNTRIHSVRWVRCATNPVTATETEINVCRNNTGNITMDTDYNLSNSKQTSTYTPVAADYGMYIWA
jgi:hypothetical protein